MAAAGSAPQAAGVTCLGRITPGARVMKVSAPAQSIVKELRVHRGSKVKRGEEVAVLRDYDVALAAFLEAQGQVAVAESALVQARAGEKPAAIAAQESAVRRQESVLEGTEKDLQRKQSLFQYQLLPGADLEAAKLAAETAREGLRRERDLLDSVKQVRQEDVLVAEKKLALARIQEERARAEMDRNRITAPLSATVLDIYAYPGEAVSGQGILDLGDTGNMFVEAEVYVSDIPRVREGPSASIRGEGIPGEIRGKVVEILRETSDSKLYPNNSLTAADKRVLIVRIRLDDAAQVQHLNNSQVSVHIAL